METEEEVLSENNINVSKKITDCKTSTSNDMDIEKISEEIQSNQQKSNESSSPKRTEISDSPILNINKLPREIEHGTLVFTKEYETKILNSETTGTNDLSRETDHLSPGDSAAEVIAERKHRSRQILDNSDSENESIEKCEAQDKALSIDPKENIIKSTKKHKRIAVFDSDSESEIIKITPHNKSFNDEISVNKDNSEESIDPKENIINDTKTRKRFAVFDSDSESEIIKITPHKSFNDEISVNKENGEESPGLCATNSKGNVEPETDKPIQKSKLAMLCDSDSEDDPVLQNALSNSDDEILKGTQDLQETKSRSTIPNGRNKSEKSKRKKSKQKDLTEDIPKKMTPKEAAELRKEIQSESQRMLREKNVSLPYHKPKSHTLRDFLARRPKLAVLGIAKAPPSVAIKMSTEQLEIISKKLEERRKEVKDFYKSESESSESDENDSEYVPPTNEENELANIHSDADMKDQQFKNYVNSHTETNTLGNMKKEGILETPENKEKQPEIVDMVAKGANYALTQNAGVEAAIDTANKIDNGCIFETMDELTRKSLGESKEHNENEAQLKDDASKSTESTASVRINVQENVNHVDSDTPVIFSSEEKESFTEESQTHSPMDIDQTPKMNKFEEKTDSNPDEIQLQASTVIHTKELDPITSESYDFHLEDESTEKIDASGDSIETENISTEAQLEKADEVPRKQTSGEEKLKQSQFNYTDLDKEIENFGNPKEISEEENQNKLPPAPVKSKLELLREQLANDKPKLSGGPDEVIDLELGVAKPAEVVQLMERFAKHVSAKKHQSKHKVKLSIVTVESGGDIHKEELAVNVDSDDEAVATEEKPGAKLHKLKEELQKQMEQKKAKLWQQKAARGFRGGPENTEDVEGGEKDILDYDDEEEAEMTDEEFTDEEEEEDDIKLTDKPQKKSAFLDQEAEVSDDERAGEALKDGYEDNVPGDEENEEETEVNDDSESDNEEEGNEDDKDSNVSNEPENDDSNMSEQPIVEGTEEKKIVLKRIVKPMDDSDEEDLFNESILQKSTTNVHLDSTVTADEDDIPPHQPRQLQTPIRPAISQTKSISDFLTPISFITSIQNLTSASKSIKEGPIISPFKIPTDIHSPDKAAKILLQKKLFTDSEVLASQGSLDVSPSQTQESSSDLKHDDDTISMQTTQMEPSDEPPNTQDLLGICSGEFTGVTQLEPTENTKELIDFASTQTSELRCLGQDDMIISQLLDEEELENFKKKFESPVNQVSQRSIIGEAQEITGGGVIDSDDDDEEGELKQKKKKNQKRIQFSDDESSEEEEEEIDLQDRDEIDDEEVDNVGYDSEENEIDLNAEGKKPEKLKLADFLEAEAELSESEWGSEDEDEKDLDQMEFEVGDKDKFDEEKVKSDLEKIHMRRMLDDDTREVKLLQELLLEDGEMHGTGRQRQFKWKNIDSTNDNEGEEKKDDDDIYLDEEESEEQWRKKRHEREMFFKQQQLKSQSVDSEEDLLYTSQLLKIGQKFLQRSLSNHNSQNSTPTEKTKTDPDSPFENTIFSLQNKRGSFLNRSDQVLQRVSEYTKVSTDVNVSGSRKTTKHFLFQSSSATEVSIASAESKKRKASEGTPNVLKKLRLNTNLSPAFKKKLDKPERAKKLFNF